MPTPPPSEPVVWEEDDTATTYSAEIATVNGHRVSVCLDDESHLHDRPMHYWDIDDRTIDGWCNSIENAKREAIAVARALEPT